MEIIKKVKEIAEPILEKEGIELVDIEYQREKKGWVLRFYIHKPGGVSVEDCALISEKIGRELDFYDPIPHSYTLEVSSPGLDRPLTKISDFKRNIGEKVIIFLKESYEGEKNIQGKILGIENNEVILERKKEVINIPIEKIHYGKLIVEF
ncbi:MAG: ribosome maturation factor RimP [Dictyoglomus sp.]|nr:ribosome maturation factor RimP [Dictyoglomus sp.]MCX7942209.1 ribosome maturation factor RimP [Dictyoglomaceae bacterium]MDW8188672.1 ribosome maturation factor RimP [Dictyoglomus sp.]